MKPAGIGVSHVHGLSGGVEHSKPGVERKESGKKMNDIMISDLRQSFNLQLQYAMPESGHKEGHKKVTAANTGREVQETIGIIEKIKKFLQNGMLQEGLNFAILSLDDPANKHLYKAVAGLRKSWDSMSKSTQAIWLYTPPIAYIMQFFVKSGLFTYKGAHTKEELREAGKWLKPTVKYGVKVAALKWPELKEIEPIIEPFFTMLGIPNDMLLKSYDVLQEERAKKGRK